jgi:hypothetical protein
MAASHARCVPVVDDEGAVAGLLDDVALLAAYARAHTPYCETKRCGCGRTYTANGWAELAVVGLMRATNGEVIELRNCASCQSTLVTRWKQQEGGGSRSRT